MRNWIMIFLTLSILVLLLAGWSKPENQGEGQKTGEQAKENPAVQEKAASASGDVLTNSIGMKLKLIPAGSFKRDSSNVKITKPFYLGIYEVTQEQYEKVVGSNPSENAGPKNPVEMVSWDDAQVFCRKLSELEKQEYRLPTEAEWEYACRAGTTTAFYWRGVFDEKYAWSDKNSGGKSHEVGTLQPNAWGLFDMSGNVWEWCEDWNTESPYPTGDQVDPKGAASGSNRVIRGGCWYDDLSLCSSGARFDNTPSARDPYSGFRVVAVPKAGQ